MFEMADHAPLNAVIKVTKPFPFEGKRRMAVANEGLKALAENVDSLIIIPNEKLLKVLGPSASLVNAFKEANNVLQGAVQGIADLIIRPGMINVDFADVKTVMSEMGMAMMGTGTGRGEDRAKDAAEAAINCPLLEDIDLQGAKGILVNITAGLDLSLGEFSEVGDIIEEFASDNATVVIGTVIDPEMVDELRVTVVATGLGNREAVPMQVVSSRPRMTKSDGTLDFNQLELPTVNRDKSRVSRTVTEKPKAPVQTSMELGRTDTDDDMEYLDIPAFLRRQAD